MVTHGPTFSFDMNDKQNFFFFLCGFVLAHFFFFFKAMAICNVKVTLLITLSPFPNVKCSMYV